MAAANTDKFKKLTNNFSTTLSSAIVGAGDTSMSLASTTNLPTDTGIVLVIDRVNSSGTPTASVREYVKGTVSGSNIINLVRGLGNSTAQAHSTGAVVEQVVDQNTINDLMDGILTQHNQDGTHGAVTATSVTTSAGITNTGALTTTGATTLNGSWDGWVGANETWTYASATTITVPTDATTKYDVGDYIKLTQSATVKIFVITSLTSTVLTVAGLAGATVANSAITAPAYSKVRTPHAGGLNGGIPYNPYKFSVYRNAAWTSTSTGTGAVVQFDTKVFDTGNNVDVVTNKGRFTAPVAGFYFFVGQAGNTTAGGGGAPNLAKNGTIVQWGTDSLGDATVGKPSTVTGLLQLAANDYVETWFLGGSGSAGLTGPTFTYFQGFLISAL